MRRARQSLAAHAGLLAVSVLLALAGGGVAIAAGLTASKSRPHARTEASERARLVARKLRQAHRRKAHAAATGMTYPDQGVTVSPPSSQAAQDAAESSISTPSAAVTSFDQYPAAQSAFGLAATSGSPTASLATVTEQDPISAGVSAGVPYQAWVVTVRGPVRVFGGPGSTPPPAGTECDDVGIFDFQLSTWTELLQSC